MFHMKQKTWFLLVKILLCLALLTKPVHLSRGAYVYRNTEIKNPTPVYIPKREQPKYRTMVCNVSAYTAHSDECGKGDGITASGVQAVAGRTIAMDGIPFGTVVEIEGHRYVVEDRFGGSYTNRIDIYMDTKAEAFEWGRRCLEVKIYES